MLRPSVCLWYLKTCTEWARGTYPDTREDEADREGRGQQREASARRDEPPLPGFLSALQRVSIPASSRGVPCHLTGCSHHTLARVLLFKRHLPRGPLGGPVLSAEGPGPEPDNSYGAESI